MYVQCSWGTQTRARARADHPIIRPSTRIMAAIMMTAGRRRKGP